MAHFARVGDDGLVTDVIVVDNIQLVDPATGEESEERGLAYLAEIGLDGTWVQTSYSGSFRGGYASLGMSYDAAADRFGPPPTPGLAVDRTTIPADGLTAAVVTYTDPRVGAPLSVTFTVNGATQTVLTAAGVAVLAVASATPGDTITVTVDALPGEAVTITVEG